MRWGSLSNRPVSHRGNRNKIILAMRLTAILFLSACLVANATGFAQTVTLSLKDAPLEKLFSEIEKQTGYYFTYTREQLKNTRPVTITVKSASLQKVLDLCMQSQPVSYEIRNKAIIIKQKAHKSETNKTSQVNELSPPIEIKGRVTNENGDPVIASVTVKGTQKGTITNENGEFELKEVDENAVLMISGVSIETFEVRVNNKNSFALTAKTKVAALQEVIVRKGYYDEKRVTTTGNVSSVTAKDIEKQPVNNPLLALQGRVPGMEILQSTGMPGAGVVVQIRGRNSMANGIDPLFIIDGVPYASKMLIDVSSAVLGYSNAGTGNPLSFINPADIESIDILKDADATAIYGTRGANGVVLITTKKAKAGSTKLEVNMQTGWGEVERKIKLLNTRQYLDMRYEALKNDGVSSIPPTSYDLVLWDTTRNTDWQEELIGGTANYTDVQASLSGGNTNTQYLISGGYHKETTVFPGDFNNKKASVHFYINNISINKKFRSLLSGIYTVDGRKLSSFDITESAITLPPNAPQMHNADGSINWAPDASGVSTWPNRNPTAMLLNGYKTRANNLVSNATFSYQLLPELDLKSNFGYTNTQINEIVTTPLTVNDPSTWPVTQRRSRFGNTSLTSWIIEPQATYTKKLPWGDLTLLAGTTIQQNKSYAESLEAKGFNSDHVMEDLKSATVINVLSTINSVYKYNALFARLNYNWQDKYIINLTARRDGSSRFGPDNQFHNFQAAGVAWVLSNEKFIQKVLPFLNFSKLRISYGTTGSDQVGDYSFMDLYTPVNTGNPYLGYTGLTPNRLYTPDLAWEQTKKFETGLELGLFKDRISFSSSFYLNRSSSQLVGFSLPSVTGFAAITKNLDAIVENKGWEFDVRTQNIIGKNFRWTSLFNFTRNRNTLVSGVSGLSDFYKRKIGYPLNSTFVYDFRGVDPITGIYQFMSRNGSIISNPDPSTDKTILIDATPDFYGGIQNNFTYKYFQLDFLFQFVKRPQAPVYIYNGMPGYFSTLYGSNQPVTVLNHWQQPGDVSNIQRFSQNFNTLQAFIYATDSHQQYGDASYIRLKNISLSWGLPVKHSKGFQTARIYVHAQNVLTITKYQGLDPENLSSKRLPPLRVITIGMQVTL
jgi:TonB-linked SusC/RagA family outer membrane protein